MFLLLQGCLKTNPEERLTIDQVIQNKWVSVSNNVLVPKLIELSRFTMSFNITLIWFVFQQYNAVPPTPLLTSDVLKEENELWPDVQEGMSLALREMRVDQVSNPLIYK